MKTSSIEYNASTQKGIRFDASFHLSDGLITKRLIDSSPYPLKTIGDVSSRIFFGNRAKRVYVTKKENGIPFLSSSDILRSDLENVKLASKKYMPVSDMMLEKGWTLISRSGTIGNCAFANAKHAQKLASEDVIRLLPNNILRGGLVYAYLASKYGHSLLTQGTFGAVIQHIEPDFVANIPIPNFPIEFQEEIDSLIQQSAKLRVESTDALGKAIKIFETVIGKSQVNLGYNCKRISFKSIATRFCRFDSQYQLGKSQLSKFNKTTKIGDFAARIFVGNRGKRNYVSKGVPFLSSSDMMLANPLRSPKNISINTPSLSEMIVNEGYILISRSGTVGNTIIVGKNLSGVAVSEHAMRLVIDKSKIAPEYVFAYFITDHGQDALKILPYGSVIVTLGEDLLADVDLPILDKDTYTEIVTLIKEYISKADESVTLENSAIDIVEQEIEKWNK